jgi:hypothetical protein
MKWIDLARDRDQLKVLMNTLINVNVPYNFGKFLGSCVTESLSRRVQHRGVS